LFCLKSRNAFLEICYNHKMKEKENNYAFIDSNNLNLAIQELGWKLDFKRFRIYLKEKHKEMLMLNWFCRQ